MLRRRVSRPVRGRHCRRGGAHRGLHGRSSWERVGFLVLLRRGAPEAGAGGDGRNGFLPPVPETGVNCKPGSVPEAAVARRRAKAIPLGDALLRRSSALTRMPRPRARRPGGRLTCRRAAPHRHPYSSLLREGLASPPVTRLSRVGSYPTISPLPVPPPLAPSPELAASTAIGGVFSAALSLGSPRVAVSDLPALWSPDFPPADGACPPATFRSPPAATA